MHRVGDEAAGESGFVVAELAVVEHRMRGRDAGRGMSEVVGEHLLTLGSAELGQPRHGAGDRTLGERDGLAGGGEIGGRHGRSVPEATCR